MSCLVPPFTSWTNPQGIGVCQDLTMNQQHNATSYTVTLQSYCKLNKTQNKLRIILIFKLQKATCPFDYNPNYS